MNRKYYTDNVIGTLQKYLRRGRRDLSTRPIFIFSCGGAEGPEHPARSDLKRYVEGSHQQELDNVICLKAEAIADDEVFGNLDLLTQEAIIADVADWLIIFAESVGSFCELGAFASLPHVQSITAVAVDRKYKGTKSFLNDGPVKTIEGVGAPLSRVFYLDLECPLASSEFIAFVQGIRKAVKQSEDHSTNKRRKLLNENGKEDNIILGSLVHELLDLVFLLSPIYERDLIEVYCAVRGFREKRLRIQSRTLTLDMGKGIASCLGMGQVVSFMVSSGMVHEIGSSPEGGRLLRAGILLHDYFMFKKDTDGILGNLRVGMALDKRRDGFSGGTNFYRGPDV